MKLIPFAVIVAAREYDPEAIEYVCRHFESYIVNGSQTTYIDERGNKHLFVDDDLYYQAQITLLSAVGKFQFRTPPPDFTIVE